MPSSAGTSKHDDDVDAWRLNEVERKVDGLTKHAVSREWLDERLGRLEDSIKASDQQASSDRNAIRDSIAAADRQAAADRNAIRADLEQLEGRINEKTRVETQRRNAVYVAVVGAGLSLAILLIQAVPL